MFKRFDISMLVPGMPFDGTTVEKGGLGGSESAALYVARGMARLGARVIVFNETMAHSVDELGVQYTPRAQWKEFVKETPHDVCVVQRATTPFGQRINARLNVVWCHDLAFGRERDKFRGSLWNVDRIAVVSEYMRDHYKKVYEIDDDDAFFVTKNGVDLQLYRELASKGIARDRKKLFYAARPERGLDLLLGEIMPRLLAQDSDLRLYIAGYGYLQPEPQALYAECRVLMDRLGDRVVELGSLSKRELYAQLLSSGVYLYPTPSPQASLFREVSCINAIESQAAGLPIVTTRIGALPETIGPGAGVLLDIDPSEAHTRAAYAEQFVGAVMNLIRNESAWNRASASGLSRARDFDWNDIARDWLAEFESQIKARTSSAERVIRHFCRNSDVVAARHVAAQTAPELRKAVVATLLEPWAFTDQPEGYLKQWERIGSSRQRSTASDALRFDLLCDWLREETAPIQRILDYGCGQGGSAIALARKLPGLSIHGTDIDRRSIEIATAHASELGLSPRASFSVCAAHGPGRVPDSETFDCALLQLVLDHVPEPWTVLQDVERLVRPGGRVYLSVAFGPWEASDRGRAQHRGQLWQLDAHDLRDMSDLKPDLRVDAHYYGDSALTGEPLGWWIVSYSVDHRPIPPIDLERHVWLQHPRQSVSASIIAGPGSEETLHWTLGSIEDVADEIVVADCGMSDEARRIAAQYPVRIVAGVDPLAEGFERARNVALDACACDWCLWIDTDEKLVNAHLISKYLRENVYHTYGIKQHHFACDLEPSFNIAARLFRRRPYRGRALRFWGAIHETPEFAIDDGTGPATYLSDVHVAHLGYVNERSRQKRSARNLPVLDLDRQRYPERLIQKVYVMRENMRMVREALQQDDRQLDDAIRKKCRETIELYREHFLRDDRDTDCSSLQFYSEALQVLSAGFEATILIGVADAANPTLPKRYRFASSADLEAVLRREARQKARQFDSQWW